MKKISEKEAEKKIEIFFNNLRSKTPKEIKKIKRLAMNQKISLESYRKLFCKKCFSPLDHFKTRINNKIKSVVCKNCGFASRWKI